MHTHRYIYFYDTAGTAAPVHEYEPMNVYNSTIFATLVKVGHFKNPFLRCSEYMPLLELVWVVTWVRHLAVLWHYPFPSLLETKPDTFQVIPSIVDCDSCIISESFYRRLRKQCKFNQISISCSIASSTNQPPFYWHFLNVAPESFKKTKGNVFINRGKRDEKLEM